MPLPDDVRARLVALEQAATPGEWEFRQTPSIQGGGTGVYPAGSVLDCVCWMQGSNRPCWADDAALIAELRNVAPTLLASDAALATLTEKLTAFADKLERITREPAERGGSLRGEAYAILCHQVGKELRQLLRELDEAPR